MKKQMKNTIWSVIQHVVVIVCGLILPREVLVYYGSEMNGVVHSISQFLSYTVLLEMGIGAVIPASLYAPLASGDHYRISAILSSGYKVYRRIGLICIAYVITLAALFPMLSGVSATLPLVIVLGIGRIASYMIGQPEQFLVISDQKGYIIYVLATVSQIVNTVVQVLLIRSGNPLYVVKLAGTLIGFIQIGLILLYVKRHYDIDRKVQYVEEPIPQKWNGIAQHVAYFVLENTDIILLTLFSTFQEISVYSVYFMVISGIRQIFFSVTYSVQPKLGELQVREDKGELRRFFASFERWIHVVTILAFGCVALFLVPFVQVYTDGITDANYTRPLFALLLTLAYGFQSIRDPYDKLILASGHFKQTQKNYIIAAVLNFGISVVAVQFWGLEGVALGTLAAMAYQAVYMAMYDTRVLLKRPDKVLLQNVALDLVLIGLFVLISQTVHLPVEEFFRRILGLIRG
ncbi:polysaccharide biosynthesis C-terminal domain-containing protein [Clostridiales bacterium]|nr:polysaccharide biosynthesis C-terminal domain-containing protein [Clostridiales bacterium]